jgi:hypothetical protein
MLLKKLRKVVILGLNPRKVYERQNPNFAILMHSKGNRELLISESLSGISISILYVQVLFLISTV